MAEQDRNEGMQRPDPKPHEDVTAGKGRRDEVGRSGIYPATGPHPDDLPTRTPGDFNEHGRQQKPGGEEKS
jgi:hypothetical protein